MEISSLHRTVQASELPLEMVAKNQQLTEAEKVNEVSRHFEAILVKQILQDAQKNVMGSSLFPKSFANDVYNDMLSQQLADSISKSGKFGLADSFKQQLTSQTGVDSVSSKTEKPAGSNTKSTPND